MITILLSTETKQRVGFGIERKTHLSTKWHLANGSCTLLQWSRSNPSSALRPSRRQLSLIEYGFSWPNSEYVGSSRGVLAHSWYWPGSASLISKWSSAIFTQSLALSSGPMANVLHCNTFTPIIYTSYISCSWFFFFQKIRIQSITGIFFFLRNSQTQRFWLFKTILYFLVVVIICSSITFCLSVNGFQERNILNKNCFIKGSAYEWDRFLILSS